MQPLPNLQEINLLQPLPQLHEATLNKLRHSRNLLAFSGGGDSTALFFLLESNHIPFDIAFVNYQTREQSVHEEAYAQALSKRYHKKLFTLTCKLPLGNFEHHARLKRYAFFEETITTHRYETLLTAHHLGDRLEWLLMQLCKGAGLVEMLGMQEIESRGDYLLIRPLLHLSKNALLTFLDSNKHTYFSDESNASLEYTRNYFRHHYATPLLQEHALGIGKSFTYLEEDAKRFLLPPSKRIADLFLIPNTHDDLITIRHIDKALKQLGLLISAAQREEILRVRSGVLGGKIAVCIEEDTIFIAPFMSQTMDKCFKERCRENKIPPKIRPYLYAQNIDPNALY